MGMDDTAAPTVPAGGHDPGPPPPPEVDDDRLPVRWIVGMVLGFLLALAALFVVFADAEWVGVDEYVLAPGSAADTASAILVSGTDAFPPTGEIDYTTVSIRRDVSVLDWLRARSSDTSELVPPEEIDGTRSADETRRITQFQMEQSQDTAVIVALEYLGYPVVPEVDGAFVIDLVPDSPAEAVLRLGDLVTAIDGDDIASSEDLAEAIGGRPPGTEIEITLRRATDEAGDGADANAEELTVATALAPHPDPSLTDVGFLGVRIETPVRVDAPFDVSIDVGRVRGPSAGLAFSLAILDVLTDGELTGGVHVATTGTIDRFGNVGAVGGVPQKIEAARRAGVEVFLVPPSEYADASAAAGDALDIRCVQTFDDAVIELAEEYGGNGVEAAEAAGAPTPERSPSPVDPDDGFLSCAEVVNEAM